MTQRQTHCRLSHFPFRSVRSPRQESKERKEQKTEHTHTRASCGYARLLLWFWLWICFAYRMFTIKWWKEGSKINRMNSKAKKKRMNENERKINIRCVVGCWHRTFDNKINSSPETTCITLTYRIHFSGATPCPWPITVYTNIFSNRKLNWTQIDWHSWPWVMACVQEFYCRKNVITKSEQPSMNDTAASVVRMQTYQFKESVSVPIQSIMN